MTTPEDDRPGAPRARITRPEPERTMPRRAWANLFGTTSDPGGFDGASSRLTADEAGGEHASDSVSRAVELGYRVIDEYVRQGQKAAQRLSSRSWSPETALRDTQDFTARVTRHASDLVALWIDLLDSANMTGAWRSTTHPWTQPFRPATDEAPHDRSDATSRNGAPGPTFPAAARATAPAGGRTRIAVVVASERPAEVIVDLRSEDTTRPLVVHALRAVEPEKPRIDGTTFEPATPHAPARLRIRVPAGQPAGTYNALVIDEETSRPAGSVSVRLGD